MAGLLEGCIKPVATRATPTPTFPAAAVNPAPAPVPSDAGPAAEAAPSASRPLVDPFIRGRGESPSNLQVWYDQPLGPDQLQGFSYLSAGGLPCAGFLLTSITSGAWQPTNGALGCGVQPGDPALAAVTVIQTSDGQLYTLVFGRVADPTITAVAVIFSDGSPLSTPPNLGGFIVVKPGILGANAITAVNQLGNTVIQNIPQVQAG
jgi:hypothetical protein